MSPTENPTTVAVKAAFATTHLLEQLNDRMRDLGTNRQQLALAVGTTWANINRILKAKQDLKLSMLAKICIALELTLSAKL